MVTIAAPAELERVEAFKERTRAKVCKVRCPRHHQQPRVQFRGATLRDVTISMSGCCNHLIELANRAIASQQS